MTQKRQPAGIPTGGQFTAGTKSRSAVSLDAAAEPTRYEHTYTPEFDEQLLERHPQLRQFAEVFTEVCRWSDPKAGWMATNSYYCDGGAIAAGLVCEHLGLEYDVHVGLYWHTDVALRAELMGEYQDGETDEEWTANLANISRFMDEHHHWTTIKLDTGTILIDANGAVRREPYAQELRNGYNGTQYQDGAEYLIYDPSDNIFEIEADLYPGLDAHIQSVLA